MCLIPYIELPVKLAIVTEIRDAIEIVHSFEYSLFLSNVLHAFLSLLDSIPLSLLAESLEHRIRNIILEIIHRFPYNESLRPFAVQLMNRLMKLLKEDNEENACIALKIMVDLHKNYTGMMEDQVQPFLDLVHEIYLNMPAAVAKVFDEVRERIYCDCIRFLFLSTNGGDFLMC